MREVDEIIINHYNNYDEDARLVKEQARRVEYITTVTYIDKYLKKGDRILEVGAGTGRYSIHYAKQGYEVDAVELVDKNLQEMKLKITENMNIRAIKGNALDLTMYKDNTFDITLVLGPLYHLFDEPDIDKAIKEAIRVTKPKGKIIIAYITDDSVIMNYGIKKEHMKYMKEICNDDWKIPKIKEEVFATYRINDFTKMMEKYNVNKLKNVAADGLSETISDMINKLNEEDFNIYVDYHLKNCEREDLMGYSSHVLYICEKMSNGI